MTRGSTAVSRAFTAPTLRYHWDDDAACLTADPELFCADRNDPDVAEKYRTALAGYCHRCTVRPECLTRQLAAEPPTGTSHRYGIAGGLTPSQRAEPALCALVLAGCQQSAGGKSGAKAECQEAMAEAASVHGRSFLSRCPSIQEARLLVRTNEGSCGFTLHLP